MRRVCHAECAHVHIVEQFWSEWTWTGELDRFELVKSLRRCVTWCARSAALHVATVADPAAVQANGSAVRCRH